VEVKWLVSVLAYFFAPIVALLLFLPLYLTVDLIYVWITDSTDWRLEDYICTLPEGCSEYIAERKRLREQKQLRTIPKSD